MTITQDAWKDLCYRKIDTVQRLLDQKEWLLAAEVMGYALECALKAASCKALSVSAYPPRKFNITGDSAEIRGFRTHEFNLLLVFSGLSDIFNSLKSREWNNFTYYYAGAWAEEVRYDRGASEKFDEETVKYLYKILYDSSTSILKQIEEGGRW